MLSDPVCGSNKVGIRCTFKLPGRMPSRDDFIWCCLGRRKCLDWLLTPSKTSCTATHTAPICIMSDWSIHSGSHTFCSLGSSVICRISTKHVNRKYFNEDWEPDWMEALVQFLRPVIFNSAGILFAFRSDIVELRCDLRWRTWIYWSPCEDTDVLTMVRRLAVKLSCLQPLIFFSI